MENAKNQLKNNEVKPNKILGQNFLIDKKVLKGVVDAGNLSPKDTILEIGPGTGILTQELAQKAKKVIAVEKDSQMVEILEEKFQESKNVKIIKGDILKMVSDPRLLTSDYKIVANIPYYLTSALIRNFLESRKQPKLMVLMLQKEVAERIVAKPPDMSLLAVSVQFYADAKIVGYVPRGSFWPVPKVDSAIIKIEPRIYTDRKRINTDTFFKIVKAGFLQPRKQLLNNLTKGLRADKEKIKSWLLKNKIEPTRRAETLSIQDWINLYNNFQHLCYNKKI